MTSLRTRIAALLIIAILTVVGLATLAASRALTPPPPAATMEPIARQLQILAHIAQENPALVQTMNGLIREQPAGGELNDRVGRFLTRAMEKTGRNYQARVSRSDGASALTASVDLGDIGWLVTEIPDLSPPENGWVIFSIWIAVILAGSGVVSLYAARRLGRPLELLQNAATRIGADATLSHIPETGPAEVRATARALNGLSDRLRIAIESRMRLVAAAGHDLRTPMTRMRLRAEFIEDDEEREKWLTDLEELDSIADSAIRLVREEASRNEIDVLRLDRLLQEIADDLIGLGQPVTVGNLDPVTVRAGPLALRRALRNLVLNGATHGGGAVLHLSIHEAQAVVTITDKGPGIPEDLLGQIFEPFFRVDPSRRKLLPGAGLGLAIAREIIERFGGRITVENRLAGGLRQIITLKVVEHPEAN